MSKRGILIPTLENLHLKQPLTQRIRDINSLRTPWIIVKSIFGFKDFAKNILHH